MERLFCDFQVWLRSSSWVDVIRFKKILFFGLALLRYWHLCLLQTQLTQLLLLPTVGPRLLNFLGSENSVCPPLSSSLSPDNCRLQCLPRETKNSFCRWISLAGTIRPLQDQSRGLCVTYYCHRWLRSGFLGCTEVSYRRQMARPFLQPITDSLRRYIPVPSYARLSIPIERLSIRSTYLWFHPDCGEKYRHM